jgi:hypothetical protein
VVRFGGVKGSVKAAVVVGSSVVLKVGGIRLIVEID